MKQYEQLIYDYVKNNYDQILREPMGLLKHKFIVPGSVYKYQLWDWDSWLTDVAITQVATKEGTLEEFVAYQKGCIENFVDHIDEESGWLPIAVTDHSYLPEAAPAGEANQCKPVLIQHAVFIARTHGDYAWLAPMYAALKRYLCYYEQYCKHESGLYFFIDDTAIGVDNDPCTFYRPHRSSASIYLNCLLYKELLAMAELARELDETEDAAEYDGKAAQLKTAVREHCYDERNGFYYSVDLNLLPIDPNNWLHQGCPRHWSTLIQRIDVWSGFLAMWAGIADEQQAKRMVEENYLNDRTLHSPYGIRTLSKSEKMYSIIKSGNPSCWLGPIWGCANYLTFRALLNYGYTDLARELVDKTITLFGRDIAECGEMHEYYHPDTGEGVNHPGFQSWNLLCANMIAWKNGEEAVFEV